MSPSSNLQLCLPALALGHRDREERALTWVPSCYSDPEETPIAGSCLRRSQTLGKFGEPTPLHELVWPTCLPCPGTCNEAALGNVTASLVKMSHSG